MTEIHTKLAEGGRVVIPAEYRRALGIEIGDEVILRLVDNEVRILTRAQALRRAQALVRSRVPKRKSLVRELIRERRREAAHE